jgi:pantoate kinase
VTDRLARFTPRTFHADNGSLQVQVALDGKVTVSVQDQDGRRAKVDLEPETARNVQQAIRAKAQAADKEVRGR